MNVVEPRLHIVARSRIKGFAALLMISLGVTITAISVSTAQTLSANALTINVTTAVPGSEPTPVVNTSLQITYSTPKKGNANYKITVSTRCPNQLFALSVVAVNISSGGGSAAPSVTLQDGMLATDFITGIPKNSGPYTASLQYTSSPLFSNGTGSDSHTVTYTVTQ